MPFRPLLKLVFALLLLLPAVAFADDNSSSTGPFEIVWATKDHTGNIQVHLYFFWSHTCPHCTKARPVVEKLANEIPWLNLHSYPTSVKENIQLYKKMAAKLGQDASSVPGFIFCGVMATGYDEVVTPSQLKQLLSQCHQQYQEHFQTEPDIEADSLINIPGVGVIDASTLSLPLLTLVLAGLDSFNPCAFFVLLFLLSLLIHARSRKRMLLISGIYIVISGLIYFLFMAAWLNLFMLIGDIQWVTLAAGLLAITIALFNIKDFFWFQQGPSLSIPASAKPGLFQRMRGLLCADNMPAMVFGTIVLAVVANSYELLCTAGFPMVFTRSLTLHELPVSSYYLYLVFYNLIYVVPLMIIAGIFTVTLGSRKLKEHEGRTLKLMSGLMMLFLGVILVLVPELLNNLFIAVALLLAALLISFLLHRLYPPHK